MGITALGIALSGEIYMCRPKRLGTALAQGATLAVVELAKSIGADITVHKVLPMGGGIGGGSSDAATTTSSAA